MLAVTLGTVLGVALESGFQGNVYIFEYIHCRTQTVDKVGAFEWVADQARTQMKRVRMNKKESLRGNKYFT